MDRRKVAAKVAEIIEEITGVPPAEELQGLRTVGETIDPALASRRGPVSRWSRKSVRPEMPTRFRPGSGLR